MSEPKKLGGAEKQCKQGKANALDCPNMKLTYEDLRGERYRCEQCGQSVWLDYDEMR